MMEKSGEIKLAVFDLDGTLLDSDDLLQKSTAAALRDLYHVGVKIMINSGRVPSMAEAYFCEAGIKGIRSCAGGAWIADVDGSLLYQKSVPPDILIRLAAFFRERRISFSMMTQRDIYICGAKIKISNRFRRYRDLAEKYGLSYPEICNDVESVDYKHTSIYKIAVVESKDGELEGRLVFPKEISEHIEVIRSGPGIIDITAAGVSKGMAVRLAAGHFGIRKEEICCIGDYYNDVEMFQEAGISIAMGNAPERVRAAADHVTADHDSGGAANAILRYMMPQKKGGLYENQMD